VDIARPADYMEAMRSVRVLADHREREKHLWSELERMAAERDLEVTDPNGKMEEVLFLVEWPTVIEGLFAHHHLALPADVLVTAMQSHQRYFPLVDQQGGLSNKFLYVTNGDPTWAKQITAGNERVLEGRIEDAEFSFGKDKVTGLVEMVSQLDKIVFHEKAGSMKDKSDRLVALSDYLAGVIGVPAEARRRALEAARLAKADQVSVMVREFADLEGIMGETYALMEGHDPEVARALREQFLPDSAGGEVPSTITGALLATVEKMDNIAAAFACGEPPSGSKDPYGLRRAAAGMVAIAARHGLRYDVERLADRAYGQLERFPGLVGRDQVVPEAVTFILERLAKSLTDDGLARDTVDAVLPTSRDFLDLQKRAEALHSFRSGSDWDNLVTVFTRPSNLAKKLPPDAVATGLVVDPAVFTADAEKGLFEAWRKTSSAVDESIASGDYRAGFAALAALRPAVDRYFDDVLVMADDEAVRFNRLRQLAALAGTVRQLAHLDLVQG
jgi:glycyl-tRNA synthetase beta chain